jgi:ribonuclease-3
MKYAALCRQLGYQFLDPQLLQRALTHRSYSAAHNERLEFLGDSVLNCTVAKYLFDTFPDLPEGDLSRLRSNLVNQQTLAILAQQLNLGEQLLLGEGERKTAGFRRPSILADALEAIFGAIMLDRNFAEAERVVLGLYVPFVESADLEMLGKDAKTLLQEYLQGRKLALPQYNVTEIKGEAHAQTFVVACEVAQLKLTTQGEGSSRRIAEQIAAERAYQQIKEKP